MKKIFAALAFSLPFAASVAGALSENAGERLLERSRQTIFAEADSAGAENLAGGSASVESFAGHDDKSFFRGLQMLMPVSGFADYRLPANVSGGGKMSAASVGAAVATRYVGESTVVYGSFDYRFTHYHFSGTSAGAPFGDMNALRWYLRCEQQLSGPWGVFFDGTLRLASDADTNLGDGLTGRAGGGIKFSWSRNLSFYAGAQAMSRLERDAAIFPFIGLDWRISRRWSLQCSNGANLIFDAWGDGSLRFDLGCTYSPIDYRLAKTNGQKRALEIREVPLTFSVTQELLRRGYVKAAITGILWSNYKFRADEKRVGDFDVDPAVVFSLEAGIRF